MASRPFCEAAMDREIREYLEDRLFPRVRGDGGWMEICRKTEDGAVLTARGECAQCACAEKCAAWLSDMVEKRFGVPIRFELDKRPFIWRR